MGIILNGEKKLTPPIVKLNIHFELSSLRKKREVKKK
jgi:hypothetical protein